MVLFFLRLKRMRKCRNWQTSKTKDLVSIALVWVQVPSSAFCFSKWKSVRLPFYVYKQIFIMQLWRNWHTRMIQVHVRVNWVWVQVPSTASKILKSCRCYAIAFKDFLFGSVILRWLYGCNSICKLLIVCKATISTGTSPLNQHFPGLFHCSQPVKWQFLPGPLHQINVFPVCFTSHSLSNCNSYRKFSIKLMFYRFVSLLHSQHTTKAVMHATFRHQHNSFYQLFINYNIQP